MKANDATLPAQPDCPSGHLVQNRWRLNRTRYFVWLSATVLLASVINSAIVDSHAVPGFNPINFMVCVTVIAAMVLGVGRLHDTGRTGWLAWVMFVPVLNLAFYCYLMFAKGDEGVNQYGVPPGPNSPLLNILAWASAILLAGLTLLGAGIALIAWQWYRG